MDSDKIEVDCTHPPTRLYSWFSFNHKTDKSDILCVGCCDCGLILTGEAEDVLSDDTSLTHAEWVREYEQEWFGATEQD